MDMLRFDQFTAGHSWVDDYGYSRQGSRLPHAAGLLALPQHQGRGSLSADLATTADTDDRVVPGHSFKYVAAMQAADPNGAPHLIRIETRAGHGSGKPTAKVIEETADVLAFLGRFTGLDSAASKSRGNLVMGGAVDK